jgi:serine/threonine-protein kinase
VDHRGDVWALGVILFELLTNTLPFESTNVMELCMKVASEPVPRAESRRADLPPGLGDVVARCLEKDPARRYQSISELVYALEPYQDVELSTTGERIRRVQGGAPMQSSPSSPPTSPSSPPGGSSARVLVHGGTSVSWGKTEASILPPPPQPKPASAGPWIALAAVALLVVGGGGAGGAVLYMKHKATLAAQPELPLPKDRTALPPLGGTAGAPPLPASSLPGSVDPGAAVNPMPDDRAPLSPASLTSAQVAPQSSQSAAPVASAGTKRPPPSGLGARPRPGGATTKPGAGGDDALPDARK